MIAEDAILTNVIVAEPATVGYLNQDGGGGACPDATVLSKNSEGTTLATTTVASGASADADIVDTPVQLVDTDDSNLGAPVAIVTGKSGQKIEAPDATINLEDQDGVSLGSVTGKSGDTSTEVITIDKSFARQIAFDTGTHTFPFDDDVISNVQVGTIASFDLVNCSAVTIEYDGTERSYAAGAGDYDFDFATPFTTALMGTLTIASLTITDAELPAYIILFGNHE